MKSQRSLRKSEAKHVVPIPKGDSVYALAKRAEYIQKDFELAKAYYREAIELGDRTESAVKDLASLLHQQGQTQEACDLLQAHQHIFTDQKKFANLLTNLQEKLVPTANCLNKRIKLAPLTDHDSIASVRRLFKDPSRIVSIEIKCSGLEKYALVQFISHSAARKTLSTSPTFK